MEKSRKIESSRDVGHNRERLRVTPKQVQRVIALTLASLLLIREVTIMKNYYKNIAVMSDRELKQLAQNCFEYATGVKCTQKNVTLLESGDSLWFRVGSVYFLIVDYFDISGDRISRAFYTSNDAKEALLQF